MPKEKNKAAKFKLKYSEVMGAEQKEVLITHLNG